MSELLTEYYGDIFHLRSNPWGVAVTLGLSAAKDGAEAHDVCTVRLSHETAKTLSMLMRKQLKQYERDTKTSIAVSSDVLNSLGLAAEDW